MYFCYVTIIFFFPRFSEPNMLWTSHCGRIFNNINVHTIVCKVFKSHYEALNIPKTATHKEIKDAYYRLSMIYHPDKNKGSEEAAEIFRDITSAYEVLGNVRQKKIYDSGVSPNQKTSEYSSKQPMRSRSDFVKTNTGSRDYHFDDWSKTQYTNVFRQYHENQEILSRRRMNEEQASKQHTYSLLSVMVFISIFLIGTMFEYVKMLLIERKNIQKNSEKNDR